MNKTELIEAIAKETGLKKKDAEAAVGAFIGVISFTAAGINSETGFISAEGCKTLWNMLILSGAISMFGCAIPMFFYNITEKKQAQMVAEIAERKEKAVK